MADTQLLALPYLDAAQAQKHVTHNEALSIIDASVHLALLGRDYSSPPGDPAPGARVLIGALPDGVFAGHAGQIAAFEDGDWRFLQPRAGWSAFVLDEAVLIVFDGVQWRPIDDLVANLQHVQQLGVGAAADANNPLTVKVNNALFAAREVAEGGAGDLRIAFNREQGAGTVSQIYQTGYSARAETGLIGDDSFRVKVSPDGALWHDAMVVDPASGRVAFPAGLDAPGAGLLPHGAEVLWPVANPLPEGFYDTGHRLLSGAAQRAILSVVVSDDVIRNALFGADEDGSWTGSLSEAFSDTAGSTASTWGGSVARIDDASPNARNAIQASASLRPLLGRAPVDAAPGGAIDQGAGPSFIRLDLSDDVLPTVFPDGGTFDVMVFGRKGSWIEREISIAAAGSLNVGPRSFNGAPLRILDATGDIAGWIAIDRTITDVERDLLLTYHKSRGARGLLAPAGEELVLNGGPSFTHADNWTPTTGVTASAVGGNLRVQNNDPYGLGQSGVASQTFSTVSGACYLCQVRAVASSTPSYGIGVGAHSAGTSRELMDLGGQSSLTLRRFVFTASGPSATIKLFNWSLAAGAYADFNDISVRRLIEQEEA